MTSERWKIRKGRTGEHWAGAWQVWEVTSRNRLMFATKTREGCMEWLDNRQRMVREFIETGEWS